VGVITALTQPTPADLANEIAGSNPAPHLPMFHHHGTNVVQKDIPVRHAVKAQSLGVDAISIDGFKWAGASR
jgi:NAD(P)H-dependent flavin oxidoreductase YrpB (nitropropane dioxygenase family)